MPDKDGSKKQCTYTQIHTILYAKPETSIHSLSLQNNIPQITKRQQQSLEE